MGDFFSRIAERALGYSAGIRPDFSPESTLGRRRTDGDTWNETIVTIRKPGLTAPGPARVVQPSVLWADGDESPEPTQRTEQAPESTGRESALPKRTRQLIAPDTQPMSFARQDSQGRQPGSVDRSDHLTRERAFADGQRYTQEAMASVEIERPRPIVHKGMPDHGSAPDRGLEISREAQASVRVSIGRVEVRAVTPTASAPGERPRDRRAAARVSLEEYLRKRNERRR
jgi:hypothetical protein